MGFFSSVSQGRGDIILLEFLLSSASFLVTVHKGWATLGMKASSYFLKYQGSSGSIDLGLDARENIFSQLWQLQGLGRHLNSHMAL